MALQVTHVDTVGVFDTEGSSRWPFRGNTLHATVDVKSLLTYDILETLTFRSNTSDENKEDCSTISAQFQHASLKSLSKSKNMYIDYSKAQVARLLKNDGASLSFKELPRGYRILWCPGHSLTCLSLHHILFLTTNVNFSRLRHYTFDVNINWKSEPVSDVGVGNIWCKWLQLWIVWACK